MKNNLNIRDNRVKPKYFIGLIVIAFIVSLAARMIWAYNVSGHDSFSWNNELMINTNDGYFYAEGARDNLAGFHQDNDNSPLQSSLSQLTSMLASLLPISFETLILYMPAFFGSLLVIPIMLIARSIKQDIAGLIGAVLGSIAWSYYNRTMLGYYDTDMLVIVLPMFLLSLIILATTEQKNHFLILIPIVAMLNYWWYVGNFALITALTIIFFVYTMTFERKNGFFYKILILLMLSILTIQIWIKLALIASALIWFYSNTSNKIKNILVLFILVSIGSFIFGDTSFIMDKLETYVFRSDINGSNNVSLNFFNVIQTVREASSISFETFANRVSGHPVTFFFASIGYGLLVFRYRIMLLSLPFIGLGLLALNSGLRFTVYMVPIYAISTGFLIVYLAQKISINFKYQIISGLGVLVLVPNVIHINGYKVPTVFTNQEVKILDAFKNTANREDYVLAWWDYGYPIRYYSDVKTLIDGAKHHGSVNYPVSFSLLEDQKKSSKMARLAVEYTESAYKEKRSGSYIQMMMDDYKISDPNDFIHALSEGTVELPAKTRDVYYYLPLRMMDIFPTVSLFSNLDLATGRKQYKPFFFQSSYFKQVGSEVHLGGNIVLDMNKKIARLGNQVLPINTFYTTEYTAEGNLDVRAQLGSMTGTVSVIYMKNFNRFVLLDQKTLNSTYIQLFVLENYDKELFELVISNPYAKVYKLKI